MEEEPRRTGVRRWTHPGAEDVHASPVSVDRTPIVAKLRGIRFVLTCASIPAEGCVEEEPTAKAGRGSLFLESVKVCVLYPRLPLQDAIVTQIALSLETAARMHVPLAASACRTLTYASLPPDLLSLPDRSPPSEDPGRRPPLRRRLRRFLRPPFASSAC